MPGARRKRVNQEHERDKQNRSWSTTATRRTGHDHRARGTADPSGRGTTTARRGTTTARRGTTTTHRHAPSHTPTAYNMLDCTLAHKAGHRASGAWRRQIQARRTNGLRGAVLRLSVNPVKTHMLCLPNLSEAIGAM